jgi:hypothetical protein
MSKFASEENYDSIELVEQAHPAATEIIEVEGGWMVFDAATDAETWRNQQ